MKKEKLQVIIKILIPVIIISGCFGVNKIISSKSILGNNKTIIVEEDSSLDKYDNGQLEIVSKEKFGDIEGFYENYGFINDNEILISAGISSEEYSEKYPNEENFSNEAADREICGELYRLNLLTLERERINIKYKDVYSDLSSKSKKINFMREESCDENGVSQFKIYDFNSKSETEYRQSDVYGISDVAKFSKDGNCLIYEGDSDSAREIAIYDINKDELRKIKLKDSNFSIRDDYYSKDGDEIYCFAIEHKWDDSNRYREGIYKVTSDGNMEEVLVLPYLSNSERENEEAPLLGLQYSILDKGKRVILTATINGKYGVYIYDVEEKKFYNVVQYEDDVNSDDLGRMLFSVSPDESKIIYRVKNKEFNENNKVYDLYAANIKENRFINRVCISEEIKLFENRYRLISKGKFIKWNEDSNKISFFTGNEVLEKNKREFMDKYEINIITFK